MKLNIPERLAVQALLPGTGNILTLRIVKELRLELSFSEEEKAEAKLAAGDGGIHWESEKTSMSKEVRFDPAAFGIMVKALKKRDKDETLTPEMISLYERFVETPHSKAENQ